jgi:glycosyltransferase involved in cell wall biosynthesis
VADRVGVHADLVEEGASGFLVTSHAQWRDRVAELAADGAMRRRFGEHGRRTVLEKYSLEAVAPRLEKILTNS